MIKFTIRKGPVSLELEANLNDKVLEIKKIICQSIPISEDSQVLSAIINGSIEKLDPERIISSYSFEASVIYLEELSPRIESKFSLASTIQKSHMNSNFDNWVQRAQKYCKDSAIDKFLRLKNEFSMSSIAQNKEKNFTDLVNQGDDKQWSCVHYACSSGHSGILQDLINCGGQINFETRDGWTPLILASYHGYLLCAEILLNQPTIQVNKCTEKKGTALHMACLNGHSKIVKLLMDSRASPYIEDKEGNIALQLATKPSILEIIPRYIGLEFLNKYSNSEKEKIMNHSGELYWSSSWQIRDKLVFLVLDTNTGNFLHYNKKVSFMQGHNADIRIPIYEIQDVVNVEETSVENKYFVHIRTRDETLKYYSKNIDISCDWVCRLLNAIKYYQTNNSQISNPEYKVTRIMSFFDIEAEIFEEDDDEDQNEPISFSSFEIIEEVGQGSFGKVFKVLKKNSGKRYALKAINKTELKRSNQYKYVIAECKILKSIIHNFIIPLYWAFQTPNNVYMVFEYCPYGDLAKLLAEKGPMPERQAKIYIAEVLLAIEYLHSYDIIYRDLKPQNILIDDTYHVKLGDFGLAREKTNKNNLANTFCGSPGYLAPETINNSGVWKPADIYSLGICLYELITGKLPFNDTNIMKLYKRITTGKINFPNNMSLNSKNLITALTQKNPEKRLSINEIKTHAFFEDINWESLAKKDITPPAWFQERIAESGMISFEDLDYSKNEDMIVGSILH
ncbi:hypothetical protein SteCoe_12195 [Stentor coeruleus]|uniref:Protein kinase domain-containing protein n=1 Tax=Stentor coeruleus TaxID=5963 RepID=A0A1R2CBG5_9CILI|nr:hypothetical protein SteCoe_12195 [Stentor coeruleus]